MQAQKVACQTGDELRRVFDQIDERHGEGRRIAGDGFWDCLGDAGKYFSEAGGEDGEAWVGTVREFCKCIETAAIDKHVCGGMRCQLRQFDGLRLKPHDFSNGFADGCANGAGQGAAFEPVFGDGFAKLRTPLRALPFGRCEHAGGAGFKPVGGRIVDASAFMPAA